VAVWFFVLGSSFSSMIDTWADISTSLGLFSKCEADLHPHVPEEKAHLFHAADGCGTEWEYLNLLHALVIAIKPAHVIETGTAGGLGTLALASALSANGEGTVVTVDIGECRPARELVKRYQLSSIVRFVCTDAYTHCVTTNDSYDFGFFDSEVNARHQECAVLVRREKISGLALFHDASPQRFAHGDNSAMVEWIQQRHHFMFPLSRGLAVVKV
jgi:predicted O-methyltransferase YrrM